MSHEELTDPANSSGGSGEQILAWEDDPGPPDAANAPIKRRVPDIAKAPFPATIAGAAPAAGESAVGTPDFRYWTAADALRRAADFWGDVCGTIPWHATVGAELTVSLDEGEDLNAFYNRSGLKFFHEPLGGRVFFSGESPDVVCHEFGHAVLDSVQPQLWAVHSAEPPALHEAFGDMSAMLSALQLPSLRADVLASTSGKLDRNSRLSRLAEQLGWAIRQGHPSTVDADCLRNASNAFFYKDPLTLPPSAPASTISSEPHSFSRVFTGAFLTALSGMFAVQPTHDDAALEQVTHDAGKLLIGAAKTTPVVVAYFSQFAAHMLAVDQAEFAGKYTDALRAGFVKHGVLGLTNATASFSTDAAPPGVAASASAPAGGPGLERIALAGHPYGLDEELLVHAATEPRRFDVAGAAPDTGSIPQSSYEAAAAGYVEDVFRRGHVAVEPEIRTGREVVMHQARATHELKREDGALILARRLFECGWHSPGE